MEDPAAIFGTLFGASLICFVIFVMPIWIFMHYKSRARPVAPPAPIVSGPSAQDAADLIATAERMEQRMSALEAIMDSEAPGWRSKS